MRIAIDAHTFAPDAMTGGDVYVRNLVREFAGFDGDDSFVLMLNAASRGARGRACDSLMAAARERAGAMAELRIACACSRLPGRLPERWFNALYYGVVAPRILRREDADVVFGANYYCVTRGPCRKVVKIHDVGPLVCPEFTHPAMFKRFGRDMRRVTEAADAIITDTEATKANIVSALGAPEEKVVAIYEAPEECYRPIDADEACRTLRERYQIEKPYFLFVGTVQPRKNVANIIAAFDELKQRTDLPHELLIVGKLGWGYEPALAARDRAKAGAAVRFLDYAPQADLVHLYNATAALVWPSFYEGIGLPLLEAMACGAPVITSGRGSMRETVGDAALLVDPNAPEAIADAMERVATDVALRDDLREKGLRRAGEFSWRKTAERTLAVIKGEAP